MQCSLFSPERMCDSAKRNHANTMKFQLEKALLRAIVQQLPDPSAFAQCCSEARDIMRELVVNADSFIMEWFYRWHCVRCPHRPWQYAVVTWGLHRDATAEQLADFIVRFLKWRFSLQQQQDGSTAASNSSMDKARAASPAAAAAAPPPPPAAAPAAAAPAAAAPAATGESLRLPSYEGRFSLYPALNPLPSVLRKAEKLLAKGAALDALFLLCPSSGLLLMAYVSKAGNRALLQQLMSHKMGKGSYMFPGIWLSRSNFGRHVSTHLLCCFGALTSQAASIVPTLLAARGNRDKLDWQLPLLLSYAARNSNAACMRELLFIAAAKERELARPKAMPQQLEMAAARAPSDTAAAGVVQELLKALNPKQLKPTNMRPVYTAACRSGNADVLRLLLGFAAARPQQQLPVLLVAAAAAGNLEVWHQLLLLDDGSWQQQQQQQQQQQLDDALHQQQQDVDVALQQQHPDKSALPKLPWSCLNPEQLTAGLHAALPQPKPGKYLSDPKLRLWDGQDGEKRVQMAELLWQLLIVQQGREEAVQDYLTTTDCEGLLFKSHAGHVAWYDLKLGRVQFMQQHGLLPPGGKLQLLAYRAMQKAVSEEINAGNFAAALRIFRQIQADIPAEVASERSPLRVLWALDDVILGHLRRACAAGDAAAIAQLDRLANFTDVFFLHQYELNAPKLLRTLLGDIRGRAVTASSLSEELGLPWRFLETILQQSINSMKQNGYGDDAINRRQLQYVANLAFAKEPDHQATLLRTGAATALRRALAQAALIDDEPGLEPYQAEVLNALHQMVQQQQEQQQEQQQQEQQPDIEAAQQPAEPAAAAAAAAAAEPPVAAAEPPPPPAAAAAAAPPPVAGDVDQQLSENAILRQQLQQRLEAGEVMTPPKQAQLGPPPLWHLALLNAITQSGLPGIGNRLDYGPYEYLAAGLVTGGPGPSPTPGPGPGPTPVQRILSSSSFVVGPPGVQAPPRAPWGLVIARAAVELQQPQLLTWSLHPEQRERLWGSSPTAIAHVMNNLIESCCTPISCANSRRPEQQQLDSLQLHQHLQLPPLPVPVDIAAAAAAGAGATPMLPSPMLLLQPRKQQSLLPPFAQAAVETAMVLLQHARAREDLLSDWIRYDLGPSSSAADLARAKAIVAAVAAAAEVPVGARALRQEGIRQVLLTGDLDLLSVVMCWVNRLPVNWDLNVDVDEADNLDDVIIINDQAVIM